MVYGETVLIIQYTIKTYIIIEQFNTVYNLYYRIHNIIFILKVAIVKMLVVVYCSLNTNFEIMLLAREPTARFKKNKKHNFLKK